MRRESLQKTVLSFPRSAIPQDVWDAWDQSNRNWDQVLGDGSVVSTQEKDFGVEGWINPVFGQVTLEYLCEVDPETMKPTKIKYEHSVRHNGGVHSVDGHRAGTPSGFTCMIRRQKNGQVQIGTMREYRPILHERMLLREDGTYIDRFGEEQAYVEQPEDFGEALYAGKSVKTLVETQQHEDEPFKEAKARLLEEGFFTTDEVGAIVTHIFFRPGITVEGGAGGWGDKGKAAINTAYKESLEEAGVKVELQGRINASGDRSWESPLDGHFYLDLTGVTEFEAQKLEEGELINPELHWENIDTFDWNRMPDKHLLVAAMSALADLNLISPVPLDNNAKQQLLK